MGAYDCSLSTNSFVLHQICRKGKFNVFYQILFFQLMQHLSWPLAGSLDWLPCPGGSCCSSYATYAAQGVANIGAGWEWRRSANFTQRSIFIKILFNF